MILKALTLGLMLGIAPGLLAQEPSPSGTQSAPAPKPETLGASQSPQEESIKPAPTNGSGVVPLRENAPADKPAAALPPARSDTGPIIKPPVRQGDEWIYRRGSGGSSVLLRQRITELKDNGISLRTEVAGSFDTTTAVYDREWGLLGSGYNEYRPALNYYAFSLYPGKRWRIDAQVSNFGAGQKSRISGEGSALRFEEVTVAAGRFMALRIAVELEITDPGDTARVVRVQETHWYVREVMRPVKVESETRFTSEPTRTETIELVSYRLE